MGLPLHTQLPTASLEGLTADSCEPRKAAVRVSESPLLPSQRKEVLDFLRSAEHLLSAAVTSTNPPLTKDELDMVRYYATEVLKILGPPIH
jgi:hypothetical protein